MRTQADPRIEDLQDLMAATMKAALDEALAKAGGQSALGRLLGTRQSTVEYWVIQGRVTAPDKVLPIEAVTGVSRHRLRPDIFPPPRRPAKAVGA